MNFKTLLAGFLALIFFSNSLTLATPIKLTVRPVGSNLIEFTFGPVVSNAWYGVYARSNGVDATWASVGPYLSLSSPTATITQDLSGLKGFSAKTLNQWRFVAGVNGDRQGNMLPDMWVELVLREDPYGNADPYGNPMGDGWNNEQKERNGWDPYKFYHPPSMDVEIRPTGGGILISWEKRGGPLPQYFEVERYDRREVTVWRTNSPPLWNLGRPFQPRPRVSTNVVVRANREPNEMMQQRMAWNLERQYATYLAKQGQPPQPGVYPDMAVITNAPQIIARIYSKKDVVRYQFMDTNAVSQNPFESPSYRIREFRAPVMEEQLLRADKATVLKTRAEVTMQSTTNGYNLTVLQPYPYARYILLVRDQNDSTWRASGYFEVGANRNPIHLTADTKGMMTSEQRPLSMPAVKNLKDVVKPEFIAGAGGDSDGDGLPDFYEVMVTGTAPDDADTDNKGVLDGYREITFDGFNTLEKFRRRINPSMPVIPPATVILKEPTAWEVEKALQPQSDLHFEPVIEIRIAGTTEYQEMGEYWEVLYHLTMTREVARVRGKFDVRIRWRPATIKPDTHWNEYHGS